MAESFRDATEKIRSYAATLKRPFGVRYNAYTETIEVLDSKESLVKYGKTLRNEISRLVEALEAIKV